MNAQKISALWSRFVDWYVFSTLSIFFDLGLIVFALTIVPLAHELRATGRCTKVEVFLLCLLAGALVALYFFWLIRRMGKSIRSDLDSILKKEP